MWSAPHSTQQRHCLAPLTGGERKGKLIHVKYAFSFTNFNLYEYTTPGLDSRTSDKDYDDELRLGCNQSHKGMASNGRGHKKAPKGIVPSGKKLRGEQRCRILHRAALCSTEGPL